MHLSVEKLLELLPDFRMDHRGKNLMGPCPSCKQNEFGISIEGEHRFSCFRKSKCSFHGNIFTLLKFLGKYNLILEERATKLTGRIETEKLSLAGLDLNTSKMSLPLGYKKLSHHPYLESRGFQKEDYDRYSVGATALDHRLRDHYVIFSVLEDGENKGFVARRTQSKKEIEAYNKAYFEKTGIKDKIKRFRNSISDFAKLLYGIDEIVVGETKTIIAVEGIFDKIGVDRLLKLGEQSYMKCNATFKCNVSDEQIAKWQNKGIQNLILLYDPDVIKVIKHNIERLQTYFNVLVGYSVSGRDPGDMVEEDIEYVMNHLEDPTQFKVNKLEVSKL